MYGCEQRDDDTFEGYFQYAYDGNDFVSLDRSTLTWTAASPQAVITKHKWESTAEARYQNNYLANTCVEWLKKYLEYGKETLKRKGTAHLS